MFLNQRRTKKEALPVFIESPQLITGSSRTSY